MRVSVLQDACRLSLLTCRVLPSTPQCTLFSHVSQLSFAFSVRSNGAAKKTHTQKSSHTHNSNNNDWGKKKKTPERVFYSTITLLLLLLLLLLIFFFLSPSFSLFFLSWRFCSLPLSLSLVSCILHRGFTRDVPKHLFFFRLPSTSADKRRERREKAHFSMSLLSLFPSSLLIPRKCIATTPDACEGSSFFPTFFSFVFSDCA